MARKKSHSTTEGTGPQVDAAEKAKRENRDLAERWLKAIESRREKEKTWRTQQAVAVINRYRDDRSAAEKSVTRFNLLWSNTETLKPAIFARMPVPDVRRRYSTKDPAARTAALIGERSLAYYLECADLEDTLDRCVEDYLLPGRAQLIVRYKPTIESKDVRLGVEPLPDDPQEPEKEPRYPEGTLHDEQGAYRMETREEVIYHEVMPEYVPWDLYVFGSATSWRKLPWQAFGALLTKAEVKQQYKHLTETQLAAIPFVHGERETKDGKGGHETGHFALFWDVWHKASRRFMVFAEGYTEGPIHVQDDPLGLEGFYPAPEAMYSLRTNRDWTPKPEYLQYQDQALELDEATERLAALTAALKVRGVYDKAFDNADGSKLLGALLNSPDLTLIPIDNFRALVDKGGLQAVVDTLPLDQISAAIDKLRTRVLELKAVIDEVTGISDIVRGKTVASETLGAQQLKAQYSGLRVSKRQARFQRFCADTFRIMFEIICEHLDPQTLRMISGVNVVPDIMYDQKKAQQQLEAGMVSETMFAQAIEILRSDKLRGFKVQVETDSTIPADKEGEQQRRVEFLTMVASYLQQAMPAVQSGLVPAAVAREGLLFGVRAFKVGSEFEEVLEQLGQGEDEQGLRQRLQQAQQQLQQLGEQAQQLQQENGKLKSDQAAKMAAAQADAQIKQFEASVQARIDQQAAAQQRQIEAMQAAQDLRFERLMGELKLMLAERQGAQKARQAEQQGRIRQQQQRANGAGTHA